MLYLWLLCFMNWCELVGACLPCGDLCRQIMFLKSTLAFIWLTDRKVRVWLAWYLLAREEVFHMLPLLLGGAYDPQNPWLGRATKELTKELSWRKSTKKRRCCSLPFCSPPHFQQWRKWAEGWCPHPHQSAAQGDFPLAVWIADPHPCGSHVGSSVCCPHWPTSWGRFDT